MIKYFVHGDPKPKGSMIPIKTKSGRVILINDNKGTKPWQKRLSEEAADCSPKELLDGPLKIELKFHLLKPKSVKRPCPTVRPDIDKLSRTVLDSLKGVIITDDSIIIGLIAWKYYTDKFPGVDVSIRKML